MLKSRRALYRSASHIIGALVVTRARWSSLLGLVLLVPAAGLVVVGEAGVAGARSASQGDVGRALYLRDCAGCHGPDARGTFRGPSLEEAGTASIHFMLATGRMPLRERDEPVRRGRSPYSEAEREAIISYLARLTRGPSIPRVDPERGDVVAGGDTYRLMCATCHGATGVGSGVARVNPIPGLLEATPLQVAEAMLVGPTAMPKFGPDVLSDRQRDDIMSYVQYLQDPNDRGGLSLWRVGPVGEGLIAWVVVLGVLVVVARLLGSRS